jgi:molybdenum cofactor guanylyltransferase
MILGAVIAGGAARRFGADKALALHEGTPLIAHAIAALRPFVDEIVVCGRSYGDLAALDDLPRPGLGPLGGIAAALHHAEASGFASVLTIGCDMPRVPLELVAALARRAPSWCSDAPILGHWPAELAAPLAEFVATDPKRSIRGWAQAAGAIPIAAGATLANVNTPEDLLAL